MASSRNWRLRQLPFFSPFTSSVIIFKPTIRCRFKTGQRDWLKYGARPDITVGNILSRKEDMAPEQVNQSQAIIVTGGAGFIGSNFVLDWIANDGEAVTLDLLTYAG